MYIKAVIALLASADPPPFADTDNNLSVGQSGKCAESKTLLPAAGRASGRRYYGYD
jgi:hypothetical protein